MEPEATITVRRGTLAVGWQLPPLAAGLEGPAIGRALHSLLEQVAEGKLPNRREDLLPLLKQWD